MKKHQPMIVMAMAVLLALAWGCKGKLPPLSSIAKPLAKIADNIIDNFEDGNNIMNTNLRGAPAGTWANWGTTGQTTLNSSAFVVSNAVPDGVNSTPMAVHVFGSITDPANASYPEAALQGRFNVLPYYDASSFTGFRYRIKFGAADDCIKRRVKMWTAMTTPVGNNGSCLSNCWNHYGFFYSSNTAPITMTRDIWYQMEHPFASLTQEPYWGTPVPLILSEVLGFDWAFSRDNVLGTSIIDYWVDEVEFY